MNGKRWLGWVPCLVLATACGGSSKGSAAPASATAAVGSPTAPGAGASSASASSNTGAEKGTGEFAPTGGNPFEGAQFYVDPEYAKKVDAAASASPENAGLFKKVEAFPTAIWLDSIGSVPKVGHVLDDAAKQQAASGGKPVLSVFVVYDLPNRDCSAKSSAGELTIENGGEKRYKTEFIDKIAAHFRSHPSQRIVAIIEPDSLPNIATNLSVPKCAASEQVYRHSVAYAISKLSMPNVSLYLDAAHAGWLGWDGNRAKVAQIFKDVLTEAGGIDKIRGFATNVSNYNILRGDDGRKLEPSNPCPDELSYVAQLAETLHWAGITKKGFIIDTSRNGRGGLRHKWGNWCNIKGAGLGERPRAAPAPGIDAYFWVKPPGDSDGTSDPSAQRFDANCRSEDAASDAPQAGKWFGPYFADLVKNANPPL